MNDEGASNPVNPQACCTNYKGNTHPLLHTFMLHARNSVDRCWYFGLHELQIDSMILEVEVIDRLVVEWRP